MKKLLIFLIFLKSGFVTNAQIGVQVAFNRPFAEFGSVMKPTALVEITNAEFFDEGKFRIIYGGNFSVYTPRLDTFRIYGTSLDYDQFFVHPGAQSFKPFVTLDLFFGGEFSPIEDGDWHPYIGADILAGFHYHNYEAHVEGISSIHEVTFGTAIGFRSKLGLEYNFQRKTALFAQYTLGTRLSIQPRFWSPTWTVGLGVRHSFSKGKY
ncbi:MAG: hypothetical protein V4638_07585 [Bacteroidota bacterium]